MERSCAVIETARGLILSDFYGNCVSFDKQSGGIGNHFCHESLNLLSVAGRTMFHTVRRAFGHVAFNDDPLQFMLVETDHQLSSPCSTSSRL
ncbi:hypothetical protein FB446DRAFT_750662 [Lentinula raphanica]|nr:hypothetical protein C8R42DRAFT_456595 [Lentinula raphanica]KAJ3768689.1 hypothetical protein FB446DRAFT_750662 [Lentinula raphanica]KAJ3824504.1 hypothetical protein F5880DRAFT_1559352 [Lentinula raphanica]